MSVEQLLGELFSKFSEKGIYVFWVPDNQMRYKFSFNTNIRHEDDFGRDLDLKTADELYSEVIHCGHQLIMMFHKNMVPDDGSQYIYYDTKSDL